MTITFLHPSNVKCIITVHKWTWETDTMARAVDMSYGGCLPSKILVFLRKKDSGIKIQIAGLDEDQEQFRFILNSISLGTGKRHYYPSCMEYDITFRESHELLKGGPRVKIGRDEDILK